VTKINLTPFALPEQIEVLKEAINQGTGKAGGG
jgi:hypothetical protein